MKFGYMGGFSNPSQSYYNFTPFVQFQFSGRHPQSADADGASNGGTGASAVELVRNLVPTSFYGQDQWTTGRLTLQGGVRLRPHHQQLSRLLCRRTGLPVDAEADLLSGALRRQASNWDRSDAQDWRGL